MSGTEYHRLSDDSGSHSEEFHEAPSHWPVSVVHSLNSGDASPAELTIDSWSSARADQAPPVHQEIRDVVSSSAGEAPMYSETAVLFGMGANVRLILVIVAYLTAGVGTVVYGQYMDNSLLNYPYVRSEITLLVSTIAFAGTAYLEKLWRYSESGREGLSSYFQPGSANSDKRTIWDRINFHFLGLAILDVGSNMFAVVGGQGLGLENGQLSSVTLVWQQPTIVLVLVITSLIMKTKYTLFEYLSAAVVLGGVCLSLVPDFPAVGEDGFTYQVVYGMACTTIAANKVYKEWIFREKPQRILRVGLMERVWLLPLSVVLVPISHMLARDIGFMTMWNMVVDGFRCVGGDGLAKGDACNAAWAVVLAFNVWYFLWIASGIFIIKHGSASLAVLANAPVFALGRVFLSFNWVFAQTRVKLSFYDVGGSVMALVGLIFYFRSTMSLRPQRIAMSR